MSQFLSDVHCPCCGATSEMEMEADQASHDNQQIDLIVTCDECGARLNAFVNINEMEILP